MDKLILKIDESVELINAISHYYEEFHKILTNKKIANEIDEQIHNIIKSSRDKLLKRMAAFESSAIHELDLTELTTLVFQTYQLIKEYENVIEKIITQLGEWNVFVRPDLIISEISQTKLSSLSKESNTIVSLLKNFNKKYENTDIDSLSVLSEYVIKKIDFSNFKFDILRSIQELFHKYPLSIDIYSIILQTIMDGNRSFITKILQLIEEDKSYILANYESTYSKENFKVKSVINPSLRYFGLIPTDVCKTIQVLFANNNNHHQQNNQNNNQQNNQNNNQQNPRNDRSKNKNKINEFNLDDYKSVQDVGNIEDFLSNISKKENIAIIYIKKFVAHPMEFSIWKLTRVEDSIKYMQGNTMNIGLSEKTIERLKILNYIEEPDKKNKWKLSDYQMFGNVKDAEFFYIIDSFNNKTFRFLKPWVDRPNKIPRSYLLGFLTYLGIISGNKKDRISVYNEILETTIYENMLLKQPIDIEELVSDVQAEMDAPKLKQELVPIIAKAFVLPKNWNDLSIQIHNINVLDAFADGLIKLYPSYFKNANIDDSRCDFAFSETLSTFLVEIHNVKKMFGRNLHDKYIKTPKDVQYNVFKNKDNVEIFIKQIIKNALDEVLTNKSNVYSSLLMKNKILTIELNESDKDKSTFISGGKPTNTKNVFKNYELWKRSDNDEIYE